MEFLEFILFQTVYIGGGCGGGKGGDSRALNYKCKALFSLSESP